MAQDSPAGMVWSLADRLGSIDTLTDKDGVVVDKRSFDSFGRVLSQMNPSVSFRYGYTARERDLESGLSYYRARYYDPNVGRFISVDPMGFGAGDTNLYRYVSNNSTNATDPSGELPWFVIPAIVAVGGALLGAYQNYSYQSAQVADRKQDNIDPVNVVSSGAWGAVGATAGLALATFVPQSIPFLAGAGLFSAAQNTQNAITATAANEPKTAEHYRQMAYLDLFGALTTKFNTPTPPSMQSAMALVTSGANALSGAFVGSSLFQHFFAMSDGDGNNSDKQSDKNPSKYKDTSDYEFTNPDGSKTTHSIDRRTSPIEIPENATVDPKYKPGKGKDPFYQVDFDWNDDGWKYNARWHTERQSAPQGSGRPWIMTRRKPAVLQVSERVKTPRPDGTIDNKKIITQPYVAPQEEIYLKPNSKISNSKAEWVDSKAYEGAQRKTFENRTDADNDLLDRGHWRSDKPKK
jgi:RHS repeat-associated protein